MHCVSLRYMAVFEIRMVLSLLHYYPAWKSSLQRLLWLSLYAHLAPILVPRGLLKYLQFLAYLVIQV
jgi:hypothetical protein